VSNSNSNSITSGSAQNQAILPTRVAFGLCVAGINEKLDRSMVTLSGVALGIAFLMSVMTGFHIKEVLKDEAARQREIDRRVTLLRGTVGSLDGRTFAVVGSALNPAEQGFLGRMQEHEAVLKLAAGAVDGLSPLGADATPHAALLLGDYLPHAAEAQLAAGTTCLVFKAPAADAAATLAGLGISAKSLDIELRPEDLERLAAQREQARYRMIWIVIVSLLITVGGITNAMLMSVTERFREIATMKCLGALSGFVIKVFLIESLLIGFAGSVAGMVLGMLLPLSGYTWKFSAARVFGGVDYAQLLTMGAICVVAGVILSVLAGIYPARVAAKMVPSDALRTEV
jgi:hypothetical protein